MERQGCTHALQRPRAVSGEGARCDPSALVVLDVCDCTDRHGWRSVSCRGGSQGLEAPAAVHLHQGMGDVGGVLGLEGTVSGSTTSISTCPILVVCAIVKRLGASSHCAMPGRSQLCAHVTRCHARGAWLAADCAPVAMATTGAKIKRTRVVDADRSDWREVRLRFMWNLAH